MTIELDRVVVGNGAAAAEAVLALRASGFRGRVDLFADGALPPYNPMLGTSYAAGEISRPACFPFGVRFYQRNQVRAHLSEPVARIDPDARTLVTAAGDECSYHLCLLATGASAVALPIEGLSGRVLTLRSFADAVRLRGAVVAARVRAAGAAPRAVVLGASFAGLEVARVLGMLGLDVAVVEREPAILPRVAHKAVAAAAERHLRSRGFELHLGAEVRSVVQTGDGLHLALDGRDLRAAVVVVCTGARPNLGPLAGDALVAGGALDVDERMRTAAPGLLAAGDVARTLDPVSGERVTTGLWSSARLQGRTAGRVMAGLEAGCPACVPCNIQHIGDRLFATGGSLSGADRVEIDERDGSVAALGFVGRRLVGFNLFGDVRRAGPLLRALGRAPLDQAAGGFSAAVSLAAVREGITWT